MIIMQLDSKSCMSAMLLTNSLDDLLLIEGNITTFNSFHIDGYLQKDFLEEESNELYSHWSTLREYCLSLIKGKKTPLNFSFIFSLDKKNIASFLHENELSDSVTDVQGLYLNLNYDGSKLNCTTGTSRKQFSMDKSLDSHWDKKAQQLFTEWQIGFELLS